MPIDQAIISRLPPASRQQYMRMDSRMTPAAMRSKFGPRLVGDDEEAPYAPPPTSPLGKELVRYAEQAQRTWESIYEAHWRSMADRSVDEGARFMRSAKSAQGHLKQRDAEYRNLEEQVDARLKHLEIVRANTLKPPTSIGEAQIDAEVRALIRAEKNPGKAAELAMAHPRAVATAPLVATGVAPDLYRQAQEGFLRAVAPELVADLAELGNAFDQFARADKHMSELSRELIDFDLADRLHSGAQWEAGTAA